MRIQPTNNNSVSHKAYFVPNSNFKILHGMEIKKTVINLTELKKLRELPNHPLEILEMKKRICLWQPHWSYVHNIQCCNKTN